MTEGLAGLRIDRTFMPLPVVAPKEAWVEAKSEPPIARLVISLPTFTEPSN